MVTNRPTSPPRRYGWQVRVRSQTYARHEHRQSSTSTRTPAGLLTRTTTLADYVPRPTTTAADNVRGCNRPTPVRLSRREPEERARLARIATLTGRRTGSRIHVRHHPDSLVVSSRGCPNMRRETAFCQTPASCRRSSDSFPEHCRRLPTISGSSRRFRHLRGHGQRLLSLSRHVHWREERTGVVRLLDSGIPTFVGDSVSLSRGNVYGNGLRNTGPHADRARRTGSVEE